MSNEATTRWGEVSTIHPLARDFPQCFRRADRSWYAGYEKGAVAQANCATAPGEPGYPTCTNGRRVRSSSWARRTSRVIGAVSPLPNMTKLTAWESGEPSVHSMYACGITPPMSRIHRRTAAIAFGMVVARTRRMLWFPTRWPVTISSAENSEESGT